MITPFVLDSPICKRRARKAISVFVCCPYSIPLYRLVIWSSLQRESERSKKTTNFIISHSAPSSAPATAALQEIARTREKEAHHHSCYLSSDPLEDIEDIRKIVPMALIILVEAYITLCCLSQETKKLWSSQILGLGGPQRSLSSCERVAFCSLLYFNILLFSRLNFLHKLQTQFSTASLVIACLLKCID